MASSDLLENTLRSNKQSVTRTRQAVFAALQGREPQSMAELSARVADTDRASI
jgi:Fe2+ or Zn2+ uptake regulation protein